jgi:hypothetical protein
VFTAEWSAPATQAPGWYVVEFVGQTGGQPRLERAQIYLLFT